MTVLVVGGGLSGLSTAMYLALHGVRPVLVEKHPTTSVHPKARGQFPHVMEALKVAGVDGKVTAASPKDGTFRITRAVSLNGPVLTEILAKSPDFGHLSPAPWADVSQERMEPILADRARELGADLRFGTEVVSFEQHGNGVTAVIRTATGEETIEADYMVAADGHRSPIRHALGIELEGRGVLGEGTGTLFEADLQGQQHFLCYLLNPELPGGTGVLVSTDVPGRYAVGVSNVDGPQDWKQIIRTATGIPDLEPKILDLPHGRSETRHGVAQRFRDNRVFLVGDAARMMPPTGAFGGNTAIMDGFSLAWKLAMVTKGEAGPGLLDSHDPERRPYSKILADQQFLLFTQRGRPDLADDPTLPAPVEPVSALFFGYRQLGGAIVAEPGDPGELVENPEQPTGRPGVRAPYVKLADGSTTDLLGHGFVLLTGNPAYKETELPIAVHVIEEPEFFDKYGIAKEGATLVRPDFVIAWRSVGEATLAELEKAWRTVLDRPA